MEENLKQQATDIIKIVLYGPESTGKTTLTKQLAEHFNTVWAEEYAREYLQKKWNESQKKCEIEDMIPIAVGQAKLENQALEKADGYLFCDTNLLCTKVFSEIYYGSCDPVLSKMAKKHKYDLFFLTDIDVPFEKDDLRDKPNERKMLIQKFEQALIENKKPYIKLSGNQEVRLQTAISHIKNYFKAKRIGFSASDFIQINCQGIALETIESHLEIFKNGISKTILHKPAAINNGILGLSNEEAAYYANYFDHKKEALKLQKFVPASGAASRMFKFLNEFLQNFKANDETINAYINRTKASELAVFSIGLEKFPFYKDVLEYTKSHFSDYESQSKSMRIYIFIKVLLSSQHFNFAGKPKGILPFHNYGTRIATPIEEHLNESAFYAASQGISHLHFTVSEEHQRAFESIIDAVKSEIETTSGTKINVNFSYQHKATDTLAVDLENNPFRDENGKLIFRPGGHGALIENLNNLNADIIFIKNIDNVIQNHIETIALYKKALAGVLLEMQEKIFGFLKHLGQENISKEFIDEVTGFITQNLQIPITSDFQKYTKESKIEYLQEQLDKPIRVCGMVKNEGEPGGGPFWVKDAKGNVSLQIVESSQVDIQNSEQAKILSKSTHFNPVDLVCGIKDYRGQKFDLIQFIDHESGFLVDKNKNGKPLKGYELPGLWNGAMAKWLTVFVEVPLITFNPVKTVNDLLKPAHQPE